MREAQLLRLTHPDKTYDDWSAIEVSTGISVYYAKSGGRWRHTHYPKSTITEMDIKSMTDVRLLEGYRIVGVVEFSDDDKPIKTKLHDPDDMPKVCWEISEPLGPEQINQALTKIVRALGLNPAPGITLEYDRSCTLLKTTFQTYEWQFGIGSAGGLIDPATLRGGGIVDLRCGTLPLLILLVFKDVFPDVFNFASETGEELKDSGLAIRSSNPIFKCAVDFDTTWSLALDLNLVIDMRLTSVKAESTWF